MFSNRCFYEKIGSLEKVAYVMINAFRIQNNAAIQEGMKIQNTGSYFECFMYHIDEESFQNEFFSKGIANFEEISEFSISLIRSISELVESLDVFDTILIDQPYLQEEISVLKRIKEKHSNIVLVEHNVSVPVRVVSQKEEYSARTIRPKIWKNVPSFRSNYNNFGTKFIYEEKAFQEFQHFVDNKLDYYADRNDPSNDYQSHMSKYLKYGFISVSEMMDILELSDSKAKDEYLEELIVRRELAYNFVYYNKAYNNFYSMTYEWAYNTMELHQHDEREYVYSLEDYLKFDTHDSYFNAAMKEMIYTRTMHGYMRMYWAKKILEWSNDYKEAYNTILSLNNSFFLDGNTANGYMNVAWIFGKHDRAWKEREVFGKLRYMNANGLKRKFNIEKYVRRMEGLDVS